MPRFDKTDETQQPRLKAGVAIATTLFVAIIGAWLGRSYLDKKDAFYKRIGSAAPIVRQLGHIDDFKIALAAAGVAPKARPTPKQLRAAEEIYTTRLRVHQVMAVAKANRLKRMRRQWQYEPAAAGALARPLPESEAVRGAP